MRFPANPSWKPSLILSGIQEVERTRPGEKKKSPPQEVFTGDMAAVGLVSAISL